MEFFCVKCQKKHDVGEIAADLWEICREEIKTRISDIIKINPNEDDLKRFRLINELTSFLNSNEQSGKFFLFKSGEIEDYMTEARWNELVLSGRFSLSLGWLMDKYTEYLKANPSVEGPELNMISDQEKNQLIFDAEMQFKFYKGGDKKIFDFVTDSHNVPYIRQNERLGYLRACPHCGQRLSRAAGRGEEILVALAGSPRAGKTSCLTAIAAALNEGRYRNLGFSMEPFENDIGWRKLAEEISMFNRGYAVTKTPVNDRTPPYSFIVGHRGTRRVITFVDMPGEFWEEGNGITKDFFEQYSGTYRCIDCIWFFVSKMTAYNLNLAHYDDDKRKRLLTASAEQQDIIDNGSSARLMANLRTLKDHLDQIPPIAVILTKAEMVLDEADVERSSSFALFPIGKSGAEINTENSQEMGNIIDQRLMVLNEKAYFNRAQDVRNFFQDFENGQGICQAIEDNCPQRTYISMAAYGHPAAPRPEEEDQRQGPAPLAPTPYHEMLPLIWTLSIMGVIRIKHPCIWRTRDLMGRIRDEEGEDRLKVCYRKDLGENKRDKGAEDIRQASEDVMANLLMKKRSRGNKERNEMEFTTTIFLHKR